MQEPDAGCAWRGMAMSSLLRGFGAGLAGLLAHWMSSLMNLTGLDWTGFDWFMFDPTHPNWSLRKDSSLLACLHKNSKQASNPVHVSACQTPAWSRSATQRMLAASGTRRMFVDVALTHHDTPRLRSRV
ncbi:hypothetical protein BJX65DRAFT_266861, partial [Aspergillus insuetus]